ncbi:MAG: 5' DNA nuclease [Rhizobium sp.]|nr:MAG: 5' DNA nuclease [Rhizobium sp.]
MAKVSDKTGEGQSAEPADFSHLADALKDMPHVPLHPLMAHPTAALAAATAIGFGFATHMTSVFLGSLHGAIDATSKLARRLEEEQQAKAGTPDEDASSADATVEPAPAVRDVKPRKAAQPKPATVKVAKPVAAKAKPAAEKAPAAKAAAGAKVATAEKPAAAVKTTRAGRANGKTDDLKKIEGVGPKLEQVLNSRGIRRFADLAALDAAELEALDAAIGLDGRAVRDDWAGQARQLARGRK